MRLDDRVYVVTGGGGAIARPILQAFAGAGARLVVADRSLEIAHAAAEAVRGLPLAVDLTKPEGGAELVRASREKWGRIDGLVHTVGGYASGSAFEGEPSLYDRMFDLNVKTLWHALRAVVPALVEGGGGFVAGFASEPAWNGAAPGSALYGAAKAAVARLNEMIDRDDRDGMERWACVVSLIHRSQGAGPAFAGAGRGVVGATA